jgi:hypothetical protein
MSDSCVSIMNLTLQFLVFFDMELVSNLIDSSSSKIKVVINIHKIGNVCNNGMHLSMLFVTFKYFSSFS